jgi:FkbM family methyltransferase
MKDFVVIFLTKVFGRRNALRLGRSLYLNARKDSPNKMMTNGEQNIQKQLVNKFRSNSGKWVVFDVGANIGEWSEYLLDELLLQGCPANIEIHTFEPVLSTYKVLKNKILRHKLGNCVNFKNEALSSSNGTDTIFIAGENAGTNSLHKDESDHDLQTMKIEKTTAYDYCVKSDLSVIHFIKIDTEGHDFEVLKGASVLFKEEKIHACQFEYNYRWIYSRHFLKDVFDLLKGLPYQIGKITQGGIQFYEKWHPELERYFEGNYIIVHNNDLSWFVHENGYFDEYYVFSENTTTDKQEIIFS